MGEPLNHQTMPCDARIEMLRNWLLEQGLQGTRNMELLKDYCEKLQAFGVPLMRMHVTQNALHPVYGAVGFDWQDTTGPVEHEYGYASDPQPNWTASPFFHMLANGTRMMREKMSTQGPGSRFPLLNEMAHQGATDYLAEMVAFTPWEDGTPLDVERGAEGAMMSWMARGVDGFSEDDIRLIRTTLPALSLALKSGANRKTAEDLLEIYLGQGAGQNVLSGEIQRGSSRWIDAVICYFDLQGFTSMSQKIEGETLIAMLNDYFGIVVAQIETNGGDVLKFMGDGLLAIFDRETLDHAPDCAVRAVIALGEDMAHRNTERASQELPVLGYTVALHAGRVLYGNIGAESRLDFTVIGPEVNLTARLSGMHRALGRDIVLSDVVAQEARADGYDFISLGRYMMRGVNHPLELFTIYRSDTTDDKTGMRVATRTEP